MNPVEGFLLQSALSTIGVVVFIGVVASTKLGDKIVGHLFERGLAAQKHVYDAKIEALKAELSHVGDRGIKANEREFNALNQIWESFVGAWMSTSICAMAMIEHLDLRGMPDDKVVDFLSSTDLSQQQKDAIMGSADKNKAFERVLALRQIVQTRKDIYEARQTLRKQGIFVPRILRDKYEQSYDEMAGAQAQKYMEYHSSRTYAEIKAVDKFISDSQTMFDDIEDMTRSRMLKPTEIKPG